jgi:antitoxin PrlF
MATATMTTKGQITVPKEIRDALNLQPGDLVDFVLTGDRVAEMRPRNRRLADLIGMIKYDGPPITIEQMRGLGPERMRRKHGRKSP